MSNLSTQASAGERKSANATSRVNRSTENPTQALDNIDPNTQGLSELRQYIATRHGSEGQPHTMYKGKLMPTFRESKELLASQSSATCVAGGSELRE